MDKMLYGGPRPITDNRTELIRFQRTTNLSYMCKHIHSFLFNMVMPRLGSRHYVSDKGRFCMYKVMVCEKVNLSKVIFFYWMEAFKDRFNPKGKKNLVP